MMSHISVAVSAIVGVILLVLAGLGVAELLAMRPFDHPDDRLLTAGLVLVLAIAGVLMLVWAAWGAGLWA